MSELNGAAAAANEVTFFGKLANRKQPMSIREKRFLFFLFSSFLLFGTENWFYYNKSKDIYNCPTCLDDFTTPSLIRLCNTYSPSDFYSSLLRHEHGKIVGFLTDRARVGIIFSLRLNNNGRMLPTRGAATENDTRSSIKIKKKNVAAARLLSKSGEGKKKERKKKKGERAVS